MLAKDPTVDTLSEMPDMELKALRFVVVLFSFVQRCVILFVLSKTLRAGPPPLFKVNSERRWIGYGESGVDPVRVK